jgi:hypothetical protein
VLAAIAASALTVSMPATVTAATHRHKHHHHKKHHHKKHHHKASNRPKSCPAGSALIGGNCMAFQVY